MANNDDAKNSFIQLVDADIKSFVVNYFKKGAVQQTYLARTKILEKIVEGENVDQMRELDCLSLTTKNVIESIVAPIWKKPLSAFYCNQFRQNTFF